MSLSELIAGVETHEKTLTVFNAVDDAAEAVRSRFSDRNVTVVGAEVDPGPEAYAVLEDDGEFVTAVGLDALLDADGLDAAGLRDAPYRAVLDHLDETMFTSYSSSRMLAASREIEDRAWRIGRGELHTGFQTTGVIQSKLDTYSRLGDHDSLEVHAYAAPEGPVPHPDSFTVHAEDTAELRRSWFVAYDGGGVDTNKCALLAEERDPDEFYGFWTYDATTVDYIVDYLAETYGLAEHGEDALA
ncbi:MAG: DICT sensory domain-containing protein [Halolamina sp.]